MKNAPRDAPRVMIWSMIWAGVTAFLSGIIMCYTVGPNWADNLDELSSYLSWFMNVTGSVYGGGVFCAVIMIGLNVGYFPFVDNIWTLAYKFHRL
jgi:choline transport protein